MRNRTRQQRKLKRVPHKYHELIAFLKQETIPYLKNIIAHSEENEKKNYFPIPSYECKCRFMGIE